MKRHLFKLALFLLLGAIVNVAVAYGCVILQKTYETVTIQTIKNSDGDAQYLLSYKAFGSELIQVTVESLIEHLRRTEMLPEEVIMSSPLDWSQLRMRSPKEIIGGADCAYGWPLYCLRWYSSYGKTKGGFNLGEPLKFQVGNKLSGTGMTQFSILKYAPYLPIWRGLIINTIFYAALLWLLILGPFTARRMIRSKRGLCIKCGYDLRGKSEGGCPECGWGREAEA